MWVMDDHERYATRPLTVAVLAGGDSAERAVSLNSGAAVAAALRAAGHRVVELDPSTCDLAAIRWDNVDPTPPSADSGGQSLPLGVRVDVVFIALHGAFGEDGQVQRLLEDAGVPYTGSGPMASQLAFSKSAAKEVFRLQSVPTPAWVLIRPTDDPSRWYEAAESIGYPIVIKPDQQGSSIGVSIVANSERLVAAIDECFRHDSVGLIEKAIPGEEWTVGLIDDELLPAIRIETSRAFFDFAAKYEEESTRYEFDGSDVVGQSVMSAARNACRAIGTRGITRVDVRVDAAGQPWVLEVNTIPGMTDHSLVPKAAARLGMDMAALCQRALDSARKPHQERKNAYGQSQRHASLLWRRAG
jgi:D-alanine-D-alanine ligase